MPSYNAEQQITKVATVQASEFTVAGEDMFDQFTPLALDGASRKLVVPPMVNADDWPPCTIQ